MCKLEASQKDGSDHFPLILSSIKINLNKNFPFRFEKKWLQHPQFESKLVDWWSIDIDGMTLYRIASKLKNVKREVKTWNKNCFGNIFEKKSIIKQKFLKLRIKFRRWATPLTSSLKKMIIWQNIMTSLLKKKSFRDKGQGSYG